MLHLYNPFVKTSKNVEKIKPTVRYVCDASISFIYYITRDEGNKSNTPVSRDAKRSSKNQ